MPDDIPAFPPRSRLFAADAIDLRVAGRLAARRRALGLDASVLDTVLGFREGSVARFEACVSRIGCAQLYRLAHVLDVDIDWFFADDATIDPSSAVQAPVDDAETSKAAMQARRFLSLVMRLDLTVQAEVGAMVKAIADTFARGEDAAAMAHRPSARRGCEQDMQPPHYPG